MQKVRAKIHLENIRYNAERFSALTGKPICAVVKANAYGHGAEEVTAALSGTVDSFAVAIIEEAMAIRTAACGKKILVMTPPTDAEEVYTLAVNGFIACVDSLKTARLVARTCKKYRLPINVHLKVNTGMNRYGMNVQTLGKTCKFLQGEGYVFVEGIYSHLCECSLHRAEKQRWIFVRMLSVCRRYFPRVVAHLGATYGALLGERYHFDGVRIGLGLYGYLPCDATLDTGVLERTVSALSLRKGMAVYAKAVGTRKFVFGGAGYGKEIEGEKPERLSVVRCGYADGFLRQKENGTVGCERNANNLCMDGCIRVGEECRGEWIAIMTDAAETAKKAGTIAYEVLCAATRRAEFVYDDEITFCGRGNARNAEGKEGALARVYEGETGGKYQP